jgi:hypothetical protein
MVAFFIQPQPTRNYFSIVATVLIVVSTLYILSLYAFMLYYLTTEASLIAKLSSGQLNPTLQYITQVAGLHKNSLSMRQAFPTSTEFIPYLLIVGLSVLSTPVKHDPEASIDTDSILHQDSFLPRASLLLNESINTATRRRATSTLTNTLRERVMRHVRRAYQFALKVFHSTTNLITIHSTKFALLVLFSVTAFQPNIVNAVLFLMFLLLAMSNNSQMLAYWKITLSLVCAMITA